jgi:hypothetical protein
MTRALYRAVLRLHPPAFREQFGDEMLWIFDETSGSGALPLLTDACLSLLRQWLIGYEAWKVMPAVFYWLASLTFLIGLLARRGFGR